jgi:hypothetical protein
MSFYIQLSEYHNKGVPLPKDLTWTDFVNLTFRDVDDDGDDAAFKEYQDTISPQGGIFRLDQLFRDKAHDDWLRVANTDLPERKAPIWNDKPASTWRGSGILRRTKCHMLRNTGPSKPGLSGKHIRRSTNGNIS